MSNSERTIKVSASNLAIYKHFNSNTCRNCKTEFQIGDIILRRNRRSSKKYCMKCVEKLGL